MTEPVTVKFYFDIASPFSYIGFERLFRYEKAWNLSIELCPVHLATILRSSGNFPPFTGEAKVKYLATDIRRNIQELQINWNLDMSRLPMPSFSDMSTLCALKSFVPPKQFKEIVGRLFAEQVANVSPPSDLFACLVPSHVSQGTLDKAKELSQTREFVTSFEKEHQLLLNDYGAFGLPWILLERPGEDRCAESFWGSDRMASMAHWLGPNYVYTGASPKTT